MTQRCNGSFRKTGGGPVATLYGSVLHWCTALHYTALCCTVLHYTALCCTVLHCIALYCPVLHCIALYYSIARYCTLLYSLAAQTAIAVDFKSALMSNACVLSHTYYSLVGRIHQAMNQNWTVGLVIFKASALWADAFYKSKCPSVRLSVCPSVRVSVCVSVHFWGTV